MIYSNKFEFPVDFRVAESLCDMMNLIIFVITFTCIIVIAFNLIVFELANSIDIAMLSAFVDSGVVISLTFVYFYLSEWITGDLLDIGEIYYNAPWYRLPPKHQTLIKLPIQRAQRELRLSAYGLFGCSLPVFASVLSIITEWIFVIRRLRCLLHLFADNSISCLIFSYDSGIDVKKKDFHLFFFGRALYGS